MSIAKLDSMCKIIPSTGVGSETIPWVFRKKWFFTLCNTLQFILMYKNTYKTLVMSLLLAMTYTVDLLAQQKSIVPTGSVRGMAMDTINNYALQSATASVYKTTDNALLNFQFTNNYGEFSVKNLPLNVPLKVEITHIGYAPVHKTFTLTAKDNVIDLKTFVLSKSDVTLQEVTVSIPPITMNGDTLEFNAGAFKLDSNAVIEDMLRKIDNITLWGDGKITVNGTEIKSVLVNGKPFFGNDAKIALQNIPKNALQKVQIYNTMAFNPDKPLDSLMEMNFKLKKGMDFGYFGKVGTGYGTDNRFEGDASLSFFTSKMQLSILGAGNNINKLANDANALIENSTFKGIGTNLNYQPNFRINGMNRPFSAGAKFTYNFFDKPNNYSKSQLMANYFLQNINIEDLSSIQRTTSLNNNSQIFDKSNSRGISQNLTQKFDSSYELIKNGHYLNISQAIKVVDRTIEDDIMFLTENARHATTSTNSSIERNNHKSKNFDFAVNYGMPFKSRQRVSGLSARYTINIFDIDNDLAKLTSFRSFLDPLANMDYNRTYYTKMTELAQQLEFELPNLRRLIFGSAQLSGINFSLTNKTNLNLKNSHDLIEDFDSSIGAYRKNGYLSNAINIRMLEEIPGISFTKSIMNNLSDRYNKKLMIRVSAKHLFIHQLNRSEKDFQNLDLNYNRFIPEANISYNVEVYGEYKRSYTLAYKTSVRIPGLNELAPLTDSTNMYNLKRGNANLKEAFNRELSLIFDHNDQSTVNILNYSASINAGQIDDAIVDSVLIDNQNRRTIFRANADDYQYLNISGNVKKAFKMKSSGLQLSFVPNIGWANVPLYINNIFAHSDNLNTTFSLSAIYTRGGYLTVEGKQSYSTYRSVQRTLETKYNGANTASRLSVNYDPTKRLSLGSNITFNRSSAMGSQNIDFTIWNASAMYRFLKGNNLELKFSALDLLRQNNSVVNESIGNSFTIGTRNVLQQYFMTTLSYYPRHFGKKNK